MQKLPAQHKGARSDIRDSIVTPDENEALRRYEQARKNLLQINRWHELAGKLSARFYLTDPRGKEVDRLPLQGDYIKIHLPSSLAEKYEWVRIESIEEQKRHDHQRWLYILVRPSDPPRNEEETEHFFSKEATSSFILEKKELKIVASVRGRNELPNLEPDSWLKKVRNILVAMGAMAGLNAPQWKALVGGILRKDL